MSEAAIKQGAEILSADDVEAKAPPSDTQLKGVRDLAADLYARRREVEKLQEQITAHEAAIHVLEEKTIPDAMREIGMKNFALSNGFSVEIEPYVYGHVLKEHEPAFFEWLEKNGLGAIIKHWITVTFGREDDKFFKKFLRDLAARKKPVQFDRKDAIHASTWKAFFKERLDAEKAGTIPPAKIMPKEFLSIVEGTRALLVDHALLDEKKAASTAKRKATVAAKKSTKVEM
jgi:hypothetical protein